MGAAGEADPLTTAPSGFNARRGVGVVASLFFPGVGHLLVGRTRRGVAWLVAQAALLPTTLVVLFLVEASGLDVRPALMLGILLLAFLLAVSLHIAAPVDLARLPAREAPRARTTVLVLAIAAVASGALAVTEEEAARAALRGRYVEGFRLPGDSMAPAVLSGDRFVANRFVYRLREPTRGDVVIFNHQPGNHRASLTRVIAVPGEDLYIEDRRIYVNCRPPERGCQPISDPWGYHRDRAAGGRGKLGPLRVPPGSYFLMADNRDNSQDSRQWGFVKRDRLMGQAFLIYWSWDPEQERVRWGRIGRWVQ